MLALGIDIGTSAVRSAVVDESGNVVAGARAPHRSQTSGRIDADLWWAAVSDCLAAQVSELRSADIAPSEIGAAAVDGTSGSLVLVDRDLRPVTRALLYNDAGFDEEAARIAVHAPDPHVTRGPASALARALRLQAEDTEGKAAHLCHQADFIAARLMGRGGFSDHGNALKTGFDPAGTDWPDWITRIGLPAHLLPRVQPCGSPFGEIDPSVAAAFGLSPRLTIHAGTTDSVAAFVATGANGVGAAVTSLGTTLAVKLLSPARIDAPELGLYSHRLSDCWLAGGASNTGGGVLLAHFTPERMAALSARIDPESDSGLDYYPLLRPGERFPVNDPDLAPRLTPRPEDDALFLKGLFEGIARIERQAYEALAALGAVRPTRILTAGGGSANPVWQRIRSRILGIDVTRAERDEAAVGAALLALNGR